MFIVLLRRATRIYRYPSKTKLYELNKSLDENKIDTWSVTKKKLAYCPVKKLLSKIYIEIAYRNLKRGS